MVQASVLAALALSGSIQIWHIVVLSIALGCINAFDTPTRQSFVIEMVGKKEDLGNAIALNSLMFNGARILGPSVAGLLLATTNEGVCFLINALSYIFVIISLILMKLDKKEIRNKQIDFIKEMKEGLNYAFGFPPIKHLLLLLSLVSLTGMSYSVLMPVLAKQVLHGESQTYGFLMGAAGIGALAGAVHLASRTTVLKLGRIIPASSILFGGSLIILAFTRVTTVSIILMVFIGMGMMLQTAASNTVLQTITDDDKRGRVMGFYTIAVMGTAPFGSLLSGALAKMIGTPGTFIVNGIATIIGALIFLRKLPELRILVRPIYAKLGIIPEVAAGMQNAQQQTGE
jgi:MFS family permease